MIKRQILVRNQAGQLDLNPNKTETVDLDLITLRESLSEVAVIDDEEAMTKHGVLVNDHGEVKINQEAAHALTALAKYYGKNISDTFGGKEPEATVPDEKVTAAPL